MSGRTSSGSELLPGEQPILVNLRLTHKRAAIPLLEAATFRDVSKALLDVSSMEGVEGCFILQTCNRVEFFALTSSGEVVDDLLRYWRGNL